MWFNSGLNISLQGIQKTSKKLTKMQNLIEDRNHFFRLADLATNRYHIEGIPETCNQRVIQQSMLWYGGVVFFEMDGAILALPGVPTNNYNLYGEPSQAWVYSLNGFNKKVELAHVNGDAAITNTGFGGVKLGDGKGVWVRENKEVFPFINIVIDYAHNMSDCFRTLSTQRKHMKRPYLCTVSEEAYDTAKKFFKDADENEELIISTGIFSADSIQCVPLTIGSDEIKSMRDLYEWYFNQFKQMCSINSNSAPDKMENLTDDEVTSDQEITDKYVDTIIDYVNEQLEIANKIWGLNMKAVANETKEEVKEKEDKEDNDNEALKV